MRFTANDVRSRVALSRLLVKVDRNPEYSRAIGIEDTSRFRSEAAIDLHLKLTQWVNFT